MQQATGVGPTPQDSSADNRSFNNNAQGLPTTVPATESAEPYGHESGSLPHQMHAPVNGSMPPQQVYVSSVVPGMPPASITGLENQFQSLGFKQEDSSGHATDQLTNSGPNSEANNLEENDAEEPEEDPVKLFVGQVRQGRQDLSDSLASTRVSQG